MTPHPKNAFAQKSRNVEKVFEAFMSPGSATEKLYLFIADNDDSLKTSKSGGLEDEGEYIEMLELPLSKALKVIRTDKIVEARSLRYCSVWRWVIIG